MSAYYNDIDPAAAQWLRNLIAAGHIAPGDVDTRSIEDVTPNDLRGYTQCHFFAGIGGWSLALRLAGWPDDRRVWTGSCPCQPFSAAGRGDGFADQRHLWPAWFHLIKECRPEHVFGEQVAAAAGFGWLDLVSSDMEGQGYRVGAAVLGAHSVGAPHIRQRLWFVSDADGLRFGPSTVAGLQDAKRDAESRGGLGELGHADNAGLAFGSLSDDGGRVVRIKGPAPGPTEPLRGQWRGADWIACRDGKARPVEPGTFPLAHGIPARVVRLRAYGNSIVPQVAAEFIGAYLGVRGAA